MSSAPARPNLLAVSRDFSLFDVVRKALPPEALDVLACRDDDDVLGIIRERGVRVVLVDVGASPRDGFSLLRRIKKFDPLLDVLVAGEALDGDAVLSFIHQGATDVLPRPFEPEILRDVLRRIDDGRELRRETFRLERKLEQKYVFEGIVSRNPAMLEIFALVRNVARHFTSVLVTGETGTGKEMIARAVHALSPRRGRPLVVADCASIPETLFESELFGYRRGAFTGADHDKRGLFEEADGGVIFLDEVAEVPMAVQAKLLRVLENHQFRPLGAQAPREVDVRVIAATNRDVAAAIKAGTFREDLYHRLNRIEIRVPPLRERTDDIPLLVRHFLQAAGRKFDKPLRGVTRDAQKIFLKYEWPGNVRELENVLESAGLVCRKDFVDVPNLPKVLRDFAPASPPPPFLRRDSLSTLEDLERDYIQYLLRTTRRNLRRTAKILGISRTTLYNKIKKYKIEG